jgi:superoxide dismutase
MEKAEYIRQLKRLLKKYHPDLCSDEHLELMYNEVSRKLTAQLNEIKAGQFTENKPEDKPKEVKEGDYYYYKQGIKYYQKIYPDRFYKRNSNGIYEAKTFPELESTLKDILLSFRLSEHFFKRVVENYPGSPWVFDSKRKINLLQKLYRRYSRINISENSVIDARQFIKEMGLKPQ